MSLPTAASSEPVTSSDEDLSDPLKTPYGLWCPKCELFWRSCLEFANQSNFKLISKPYETKQVFKCSQRRHKISVKPNKRLQGGMQCGECRK